MTTSFGRSRPHKNNPPASQHTLLDRTWALTVALVAQVFKHVLDHWWTN